MICMYIVYIYRRSYMYCIFISGLPMALAHENREKHEKRIVTDRHRQVVACDSPVGKLGVTVCYDVRFPELFQKLRFQHGVERNLGTWEPGGDES